MSLEYKLRPCREIKSIEKNSYQGVVIFKTATFISSGFGLGCVGLTESSKDSRITAVVIYVKMFERQMQFIS